MQTYLWPIVQALDPVTLFNRYPCIWWHYQTKAIGVICTCTLLIQYTWPARFLYVCQVCNASTNTPPAQLLHVCMSK